MFFPIPCDAMSVEEETALLSETRCPPTAIHTLLSFTDSYRKSVSADSMQKNRKLGTRTLLRIARKVALHPQDADLHTLIGQALLSEFLPAAERMNLDALLRDAAVLERLPVVRLFSDILASADKRPDNPV
jgi:von Willebrand factor A domain-containing protein 8